jgi:hypothetical protein
MSAHPVSSSQAHVPDDGRRRSGSLLGFGAILIVIGLVAALLRGAEVDLSTYIGETTWPLLVVIPGLVLLALSPIPRPPEGLGVTISGSIVTTVGLILLWQATNETWESWAYVWALIPGAAGLGIAAYGAATRATELVERGVRMVLIAGVLFLVGRWYFEAIFTTGEQPIDVGTWWPVALIGVGALIAVRALFETRHAASPDPTSEGRAAS